MGTDAGGQRRLSEVKGGYADRLIKSPQFEIPSPGLDHAMRRRRAFIFRWPGDWIEGQLIAGPLTNSRRNASYILETDGGEEIEFFGNKQLHCVLPDLRGKRVRIEYVGHQRVPRCKKPRKVYRVWTVEGLGLLGPEKLKEQEGSGGPVETQEDDVYSNQGSTARRVCEAANTISPATADGPIVTGRLSDCPLSPQRRTKTRRPAKSAGKDSGLKR